MLLSFTAAGCRMSEESGYCLRRIADSPLPVYTVHPDIDPALLVLQLKSVTGVGDEQLPDDMALEFCGNLHRFKTREDRIQWALGFLACWNALLERVIEDREGAMKLLGIIP